MSSQQHRWILSGGMASGKSAVRLLLAEHGFYTIDADSVGHEVLRSDSSAFEEVARRWSGVIQEGEVDRAALAEIVFKDPKELAALEAITHPHIFDRINDRVKEMDAPVIVEVPVLKPSLGSGWGRMTVDSRDEVRLLRAVERGMAEADARSRMAMQPSRGEWLARADLVVPNHGTVEELNRTVDMLIDRGRL